ncbi:MAG TPA: hypothetical protein VNW54_14025 [Granulicella sp.]|nr:hypothetical protein [Granulicella sp.]
MNWRQGAIGVMGVGMIAGSSVLWNARGAAQMQFGADQMPSRMPVPNSGHGAAGSLESPADPMSAAMAARSRFDRNVARQKRLVSDTQRLLALANELRTEVLTSGTETMTPAMLHKMDEIEKLARSVKDKMRD